MRLSITALSVICCVPTAVSAQSARQDKTINLPAGVSIEMAGISRAGNLVAAICSDHVVRVWSAHSGEMIRTLKENSGRPSGVQFSSDGRLLAISYETVPYEEGTIKVFDVDSWKVQSDLTSECMFCVLSFSADGRRLASAGNSETYVWDIATQKKLATISPPFGGSAALSFSPDGRWVATADGDGFVRVYNASTGTLRGAPTEFLLEPFTVAFSPDGKSVLAGGADKIISIIDPQDGKISRAIPNQPGLVESLAVSANGKLAAVVYGAGELFMTVNHIELLDLDKGAVLVDFQKSGITIIGGVFVSEHYVFATESGNTLTLWSIP